jgi:hypothetical protein
MNMSSRPSGSGLCTLRARAGGFAAETCVIDKGYDLTVVYEVCEDRDWRSIMPLRETPTVKAGAAKAQRRDHGK